MCGDRCPENEGSCGPSQEWVAPLVSGGPLCAWPLTVGRALPPFQLPILLKGTSDDDVPCPGYLFEEIAKITHESLGSSQCLLEYLLSRLQSGSGRVKLKVLKIMLHLCGHGSSSFLLILKRNPAFIQEAAGLLLRALVSLPLLEGLWEDGTGEAGRRGGALACRGPGDSFHGTPGSSPREQLVPEGAGSRPGLGGCLVLGRLVTSASFPATQGPASSRYASMGSQSRPQSSLQGFGYSKERGHTGSAGEAFLSTIQKAAEVVASAMRPGPESPSSQRSLLRGDAYQPAVTPSAGLGPPTPGNPLPTAGPGARAMRHQPGQAGGGWEELDSSPNSQDSSQENDDLGKASDSGSPSGSDSPSGASRAPSDLAERVEAVILSDCQQELNLVRAVTRGPHCFLSREEVQHFVKECGLLNCEAVLELLIRHLGATSERVQMRALGAIASLGCTDLLSQERVLLLARPRLQELSVGSPGPVTNKATKLVGLSSAPRSPAPGGQKWFRSSESSFH
ncbi:AP-4 complex accessory subunit tepsin isoform X9 [Globicephala melas]|uniref:AP-4 complex accessory subunit tepsin isoform X9 n=1 Tax=Globicephala melas TaxID=9731 RepID=UPI00293D3EE0|nr:AP-4 complex accessory subunit tepsin isoform X9 [Globicephala melas]